MSNINTTSLSLKQRGLNRRRKLIVGVSIATIYLILVVILGTSYSEKAILTNFAIKNEAPSFRYLFGTDWMGRDMFARTIKGLSLSIVIGVGTALISTVLALIMGILAAVGGRKVDSIITFLIDIVLGIPHILLMILISVAVGRGLTGVIVGVALTHWPSLARIIRAEIMQLKEAPYIHIAEKLGKSKRYIVKTHMMPHLVPQVIVGTILIFPHAILHEAAITFLGFGLSSGKPAIGVILSESMEHLMLGSWWTAFCPGIMLAITVGMFYWLGDGVRKIIDPSTLHE